MSDTPDTPQSPPPEKEVTAVKLAEEIIGVCAINSFHSQRVGLIVQRLAAHGKAQREKCASLCDEQAERSRLAGSGGMQRGAANCATAIRAMEEE